MNVAMALVANTHCIRPRQHLNPAHMDFVAASDTIQCHSQGQPLNLIEGKYYDWPVGYNVGTKLGLLEAGGTHARCATNLVLPRWPAQNRMQGNDFVQASCTGVTVSTAMMSTARKVTQLRKPADQLCLTATVHLHRTVHARPPSKSTRITRIAVRAANASRVTCLQLKQKARPAPWFTRTLSSSSAR